MTYHDLMPEAGTITVEEYLLTGPRHSEFVRGRVVELIPPGGRHGRIVNQLPHRITTHVLARNLGTVLAQTGFVLERGPDTVRAPDIAFVARNRMKDIDERGVLPGLWLPVADCL